MKTQEVEFTGMKLKGIPVLIFNLILMLGSIAGIVWTAISFPTTSAGFVVGIGAGVVCFVLSLLFFNGFMQIEPNEARVMVFFGEYEGSVKENGFFWVNPFYEKQKLTLRARNLDADPIKVNDKTGNPILIGMILVWRVKDTYRAAFNVDNKTESAVVKPQNGAIVDKLAERMKSYEKFVKIQSDAALRHVAGLFAYDKTGIAEESEVTLRAGGEEINEMLEKQVNDRISIAGIEVVEARINYLAYAPEIAAVMLRRQQADAIISAREKIVDGAVGMVKLALNKLAEEGVVELDEDKKAAMVSNLLVVLCSEEQTQPVVNAGTLHQ